MSDVLVIIPTYNEIENISNILETVMKFPDNFDVLVIDDNSPDGTAEAVERLMKEYPGRIHLERRAGKLGLGTAYIHGFKWALKRDYGYVIEMDADFSHNPADLTRLYHECKDKGTDLCIGSRYITGVNVVNWPMGRVLMSYFASAYVRLITGMTLRDSTAAFQIEMKFKAYKMGFKITELPIIFINRQLGTSKMNSSIFGEAMFGVIKLKLMSMFRKKKFQSPR